MTEKSVIQPSEVRGANRWSVLGERSGIFQKENNALGCPSKAEVARADQPSLQLGSQIQPMPFWQSVVGPVGLADHGACLLCPLEGRTGDGGVVEMPGVLPEGTRLHERQGVALRKRKQVQTLQ
jgi:hypothetical protein